jgi:organic radical activating enzyme
MAMLPVMEHFYTIQGEGYNSGLACYFIRLGGCDVGCVWCEVKESWDAAPHPRMSIEDIVQQIKISETTAAVITGGEPLMYDMAELTSAIQSAGIKTFLETSGAYPLTGSWDWICVSPKKFKAPLPEVLQKADELKVIVYNKSDFQWAEQQAVSVLNGCKLYLQPEYSVFPKMIPDIVSYVKQNPQWKISLQAHKVMNIP